MDGENVFVFFRFEKFRVDGENVFVFFLLREVSVGWCGGLGGMVWCHPLN